MYPEYIQINSVYNCIEYNIKYTYAYTHIYDEYDSYFTTLIPRPRLFRDQQVLIQPKKRNPFSPAISKIQSRDKTSRNKKVRIRQISPPHDYCAMCYLPSNSFTAVIS